jgi:hypothetical protein
MEAGVTFEVLVIPVCQTPLIHSPVESIVPVETLTPVGIALVLTVSVILVYPEDE